MRGDWEFLVQLVELALDLGLDVEGGLSLAGPPLVARDDQLAHLVAQRGVVGGPSGGGLGEQAAELGVDVQGGLAAGALAVGLRLQELADFGLAHLRRRPQSLLHLGVGQRTHA